MSSVVAKQATQHIAHFIAAPDTKVPLTQGRAPPPHTHSPRRVLTAHSRPPRFPFFLFFFFFPKAQTPAPPPHPPGNDWWSSHLMVYSSHTKHSNSMFSVSCSLAPAQETLLHHTVCTKPLHTQPSQPLTFSVHMLTAGLGTTQKTGTGGKPRATQTPHTTGALSLLT